MATGATGSYDIGGNRILAALPEAEQRRLQTYLEPVELSTGDLLYRPGGRIEAVWFPLMGVCSILAELDGPAVEVATVGDEGMVGLPVFLGVGSPTERVVCQVAGFGLRMEADRFRHEIAVLDGPLQQTMQRSPSPCSPSWRATRGAIAATAPASGAPAGCS
ncbi:Crp/Fnr family transcriptional regulator [Streptomyces chrestomyceticus]|uniref:Crp/Fnr family transcriptional regulator n=1 Tax=Streptomyces chrestomyceticus TaxID=68185 RepID=UPI0033F2DC68